MSLCDVPVAGAPSSDDVSAWGIAAAIAHQAVSSTITSQRQAAKRSLRLHLKSIAPLEWPEMCYHALKWIQKQVRSSSGSGGLVAAAVALIEENALRYSAPMQPSMEPSPPSLCAAPVAGVEPSSCSPALSVCVARDVMHPCQPSLVFFLMSLCCSCCRFSPDPTSASGSCLCRCYALVASHRRTTCEAPTSSCLACALILTA